MTENTTATTRTIPEINAVDGFAPAEFTRSLPNDDGSTSLYMDVKYRLLWFRLHCPNGKADPEIIHIDDKCAVVCCKIYRDRTDPADQYIGKGYVRSRREHCRLSLAGDAEDRRQYLPGPVACTGAWHYGLM